MNKTLASVEFGFLAEAACLASSSNDWGLEVREVDRFLCDRAGLRAVSDAIVLAGDGQVLVYWTEYDEGYPGCFGLRPVALANRGPIGDPILGRRCRYRRISPSRTNRASGFR